MGVMTMRAGLGLAVAGLLGGLSGLLGCSGQQQRPTAAQCEEAYQVAIVGCDAALAKPDDVAKCHAAALAVRMACEIVSTPEPAAASAQEATEVHHATRAERWGEAWPLLLSGQMSVEEYRAYVGGG